MGRNKQTGDLLRRIKLAVHRKSRKDWADNKRNEQISHHYIYNSLQVIAGMCDKDPVKAKASIIAFADYLRLNLDNVMAEKLIPFGRELEYTRVFLELERLAGDRNFDVEYRLNIKDFMIPPLTLQPIVENAVRYGADRNGEKTEIIVTTFETNRGIIIEVTNTVPSDPVVYEKKENRKSVGLENVRSRLASYCRGALDMQTSDGVTRVTIKIPKAKRTGGSKTRA